MVGPEPAIPTPDLLILKETSDVITEYIWESGGSPLHSLLWLVAVSGRAATHSAPAHMATAGSQARLLIGLSLGKICRGGGGLRRNLMVATVLQKARLVFMEEAKLARRPVSPDVKECRVNAPDAPIAVSDKSENKVAEQSTVLRDDLNSRLREEPPSSVQDEASVRNSTSRSAGVKRPCEEKQEVKRVKYSPAGCRPPPPRAPHLLPIAV